MSTYRQSFFCALILLGSTSALAIEPASDFIPDIRESAKNTIPKPNGYTGNEPRGDNLEFPSIPELNFHPIQAGLRKDGHPYQIAYEPQRLSFLVTIQNPDGTWVEETLNWEERRHQIGAQTRMIQDLRLMYGVLLTSKQATRLFAEANKLERLPTMRARRPIVPVKRITTAYRSPEGENSGVCFERGPDRKVRPCRLPP